MTRQLILGRLVVLAAVAGSASVVGVPWATAGDAVHYQRGVAHEVIVDATHVLVLTDGSKTSVDLAVDLAAAGLAQSLTSLGMSSTSFEVTVSVVTPQVIEAIAQQPGVVAAHPVIRFRAGGQPFGVTDNLVVKFRSDASAALSGAPSAMCRASSACRRAQSGRSADSL